MMSSLPLPLNDGLLLERLPGRHMQLPLWVFIEAVQMEKHCSRSHSLNALSRTGCV